MSASDLFNLLLRPRDIDYLLGVDFDTFQWTANVVAFVEREGWLGISNLFGAFFFFVPRFIWAGKPEPSGFTVSETLGYVYGNVSTPLFAEFYLVAGLFGVAMGMALVGWGVGCLERRATAGEQRWYVGSDVLIALVGGFTIIIMRGPLGGIMAWVGPPLLTALVIVLFLVRRTASKTERVEPVPSPRTHGDWRDRFAATRQRRLSTGENNRRLS